MRHRIFFLICLFIALIVVFVVQKPLFMLYQSASAGSSFMDYIRVITHGLTLDASMAGNLIIVPYLFILGSLWIYNLKIRTILIPYFVVVALLISIAFIVDMSLYDFWKFKLDGTVLIYLNSPSNVTANVSTWFIIFRIFLILIWATLVFLILKKITPKIFGKISSLGTKIAGTFLMLFIGGIIFLFIRGGITDSTANIGKAYFSNNQFLNHSAVNPMFSFFYSLGKSEDFLEQFNFFEEEERGQIFKDLYIKGGTTQVQLLDTVRPNILIILLESFSGSITEAIGRNPDITPNFNRLVSEGIFFSNFWSNSFRTDRGVLCALSGHPALPTTSIMKMPIKSKNLPSIASSLSKVSYQNDWFYGGDINFTNMQSYLRSSGYDNITSRTDFSLKEQTTNAWGVTDHIMFSHVIDVINTHNSPWHTGFLTLSSHDPFEVPFNRFDKKIPNSFAYTDSCLGDFIGKLKKSHVWDNLLIICLSDHGCTYPEDFTTQTPEYYHTPMLWLGGAIKEPQTVDILMNQSDLAATLLGQLQLPHDDFLFSRDIFSNKYTNHFVFFSFPNGFGLKDSTGVSIYDNNPDRVILEEPSPNETRVRRAKAILQTLYDDLGRR